MRRGRAASGEHSEKRRRHWSRGARGTLGAARGGARARALGQAESRRPPLQHLHARFGVLGADAKHHPGGARGESDHSGAAERRADDLSARALQRRGGSDWRRRRRPFLAPGPTGDSAAPHRGLGAVRRRCSRCPCVGTTAAGRISADMTQGPRAVERRRTRPLRHHEVAVEAPEQRVGVGLGHELRTVLPGSLRRSVHRANLSLTTAHRLSWLTDLQWHRDRRHSRIHQTLSDVSRASLR